MLQGDVVDQFHHVDGLAHAGAAEQADLAALGKGADQIDNLDARLQQFVRGGQVFITRRRAVNRGAFLLTDGTALVDGVAQHIHDATQGLTPYGYGNRRAGVFNAQAARQTLR